jgi:flagellar protein FlaG
MASVSASHLIIFIASLVIAAGVVGTLTTGVDRVSSAIDDRSLDVSQQVRMDMAIISDPGATSYSGSELTIYVRNTGSQGVQIADASSIDIIFNGQYVSNSNIELQDANGGDDIWRPSEVVEITIDGISINTDSTNRLLLTVNEDEETFEFRGS